MNFRRPAVVLLAALLVAALTARLGWWQLDRAAQKRALQTAMQSQRELPVVAAQALVRDLAQIQSQVHRRVELSGEWIARATVYLDNRQMNGRVGFYALTPLLLDDGSAVLVERGWLPRDLLDRTRIVAAPAPPGRVSIRGRIALAPSRLFEFSGAASGAIRQNLDLSAYARETALKLLPLVVVQEDGPADIADGLLRQWPAPTFGIERHYGYAVQWFALSALTVGLYVWFALLAPRRAATRISASSNS